MERILMTGASGAMGTMLRTRLARPGRMLRLTDLTAPAPAASGENVEVAVADIRDLAAVRTLCDGVDAVVHLGGIRSEDTWERILDVNVNGTRQVLEAARQAGVPRVVLASSNHAAGMYERDAAPAGGLADDVAPRPDTYYGWGKAAIEALGRLYVDRYGMDVIALRIGTCADAPANERVLATWLSPDDAGRLVEASLSIPAPGFRIVWGASANARSWWSPAGGRALGYAPLDDAEVFAGTIDAGDRSDLERVGGPFCRAPIGVPYQEPPAR